MLAKYRNGISTIISCQNEESLVALSILSFLRFSDEVIVVDNGSTDGTVAIARQVADAFPNVRFYSVPELNDLYHNRQYGLERSHYRWVVRADSDYVCYTSGVYDCLELRHHLLKSKSLSLTDVYWLPHPNLRADYFHTVSADNPSGGNSILGGESPRVYRRFPGMKFQRLGRWEGIRIPRPGRFVKKVIWKTPIYMHCTIKSKQNLFFRSERTNWRELGDFETYPTLGHYIDHVAATKYGASTLEQAIDLYEEKYLKYLQPYDPEEHWPYPDLIEEAIRLGSGYLVRYANGRPSREYLGAPDTDKLIEYARQHVLRPDA